ncbi:glycosyltransferase family 4 protein [Maribacter sp. SA7]|uniref:glycosyltransferase family 4 protein n=1 Tax=Maribacter zhoushanensis TaxID=3030012 RepID=UPI0023EB4043|nr:glycosyltransferase family 4 protein [Maribacter zhoushanensis]MDF4201843.1 glycosyltransferase family 4 protein [Maribacter zhoushanensis]
MKKILISAYACSPIKGSEEGRGWNWALGLAEIGYNVYCVTNFDDKDYIEEEVKRLNLPNLHIEFVKLAWGLDEKLFDPNKKSVYLHYYLWKKKASNRVLDLHKQHNFDIAHHVSYGSIQQGSCLYKLENCKIIFGPVGGGQMALPIFKQYFGNAWTTEIIRGWVSKFLLLFSTSLHRTLKKATYIISTNGETKMLLDESEFSDSSKSRLTDIYAIPKSYNNLEFIERSEHKVLNIIWIGRVIPRKGLNLSLHALSFVPKNIPYKLTIVGGGKSSKLIEKWIKEYNLDSSKIEVLGKVPFAEVDKEYRKADIMLFCSMRDTSGTQIMEAMAYSLPLVVLNISGARNLVPENCAIKIDPSEGDGTAKDIAKAIIEFQSNPELLKEKAFNAYSHAMNSKWERRIKVFTEKYYEN